jgi:hypothetical protein
MGTNCRSLDFKPNFILILNFSCTWTVNIYDWIHPNNEKQLLYRYPLGFGSVSRFCVNNHGVMMTNRCWSIVAKMWWKYTYVIWHYLTTKIIQQYATTETIRIKAHENRCVEWNFICGHISEYSDFMCRYNFVHFRCSELLITFVVMFTLWTIKSESSVLNFVIVHFFFIRQSIKCKQYVFIEYNFFHL